MTTILVILGIAVAIGILAMFWEMRRQLRSLKEPKQDENQQVLMEWLKEMREDQRHTGRQVSEANKALGDRLDNAAKVINTLNTEVGKMQKMGQSIEEMQQIFRSPKLRGNAGESLLKDVLSECLPKAKFKLQYPFKSGEKVDAVLFTKAGLIPIDSKFPLEKYLQAQKLPEGEREPALKEFHKQVRKHIDEISRKYILPGEQTVDYAFMYVPGEALWTEIYNDTSLFEHAANKQVMLVSPNNFYMFLQLVLKSYEGEQIGEKAKQVLQELRSIQGEAGKLGIDLDLLHKHLGNATKTIGTVNKTYGELNNKIRTAGSLGASQMQEVEQLSEIAPDPDPNQPKLHETAK